MPLDLLAEILVQGFLTGLVYGLMSLGLSVIFGVVRVVNFAHGELTVLAMYVAWLASVALRLDPLIAAAPIAVAFFCLGYILQRTLISSFAQREDHQQFILFVGLAIVIVNGLQLVFGPDARHVETPYGFDSWAVGSIIIDKTRAYAACGSLVVAAGLFVFFYRTRTGVAVRACADNLTGALVVGLDVRTLYAVAFGIGLACAGVAGAFLTMLGDATPTAAPAYTLLGFIIVIVGGMGSMSGALCAGVLIGIAEALASVVFSPSLKSLASFALLIFVLVVRPQGLLGRRA